MLDKIEMELHRLDLWETSSPSVTALASQLPFALDTLTPSQWLQWVFLPKMRTLLVTEETLLNDFSLFPYFEETLEDYPATTLLALIQQIDQLTKD